MNRQELAIRLLEHLQGKHNQKSHGNKYGSAAAIKANVGRLGGDKAALKAMAGRARKDKGSLTPDVSKGDKNYQRGLDDGKYGISYIPDFKSDKDKKNWETGYKAGLKERDNAKPAPKAKPVTLPDNVKINKTGTNEFSIMRGDGQKLGAANSEDAARIAAANIHKEFGDINQPVSMFPKGAGMRIAAIVTAAEDEAEKLRLSNREKRPKSAMRGLVRQL